MWKELLSVFRGETLLREVSQTFIEMLNIVREMVVESSLIFWEEEGDQPERREALYRRDIEVNKLEREIRKRVATHLAVADARDVPYSLVMMSVVKDVERIGDYAKNLVDIADLVAEPLPEHRVVTELMDIRRHVEELSVEVARVFSSQDKAKAAALSREGRRIAKHCDRLVIEAGHSDLPTPAAVKIAVGARFYKRLEGHMLNILSSVIMPLHKLDYFDEDLLHGMEDDYAGDD